MFEFNKLSVGTKIEKKDCILSEVKEYSATEYCGTLTDDTGSIFCRFAKRFVTEDIPVTGKPLTINVDGGYTRRDGRNVLQLQRLELSNALIQKPVENAFSEDKIKYYLEWVNHSISKVNHPGYRQLIGACLSDDFMKKLEDLPATLAEGCTYPGGALQQTVSVLKITGSVGCDYIRYGNESYTRGFNWDALITATLLQFYGNMKYYFLDEESGKILKTEYGLHTGYYAALDLELQKIIITNDIPLTDTEFSFLLNILGASVRGGRNGVRAVSKEGMLLKAMNDAFVALDIYDSEYQRLTKKNTEPTGENLPYLYSDRLDAYIVVGQKEKPKKEGGE